MTKEIIVNAGELESRVAILENGRLMELHVEREPKIVGNIYKGRVTKVLKGMDAAFVDIGVERNAFLAASDVVPDMEEDGGHGRSNRGNVPPINQLLRANQEILAQVVRAPLGTKGARITTRLSLPGRYMVLMLNSGNYVGVSRKIEDSKERTRLRAIANEISPAGYSLIVRTEAEGKSEEELRQDVMFLTDMARRIETKADTSSAPSLIHGDLTLIFRLIRDAFTRDVNRLVVDSPATYENVLELVGMIAPRMKNRVFLYDEAMPIFHAYNVEPEIERTLRRKVWLPSGGSLVIDQAEALTAIDVNTGRFVGSVELAETVLTTNLQAAEEAARQLRLRDLGGIIVVDFIDMDNPKHRQQVTAAFEEALRRDRAKIKVHNISPLGLVEMTRKRTGDSLVRLLTEPCPYCSGIGRVQNSLTMALRIERELAATAVEHPETEAYLLTAHPRVIASMMGYEGEAHHDLEAYLERPVYLRVEDEFHPNAYRLERLTLEQALVAVKTFEEGDIVEGQVVNPDPEVSLSPLVQANDMFIVVHDLDAPVGARVKVRITDVGTSLAVAEPLAAEQRGIRAEEAPLALQRPPLVLESVLPLYLREERAAVPPHGLQLLSPTAQAVPTPVEMSEEEELSATAALVESAGSRRRKKSRRRKRNGEAGEEEAREAPEEMTTAESDAGALPVDTAEETAAEEVAAAEQPSSSARRRRRRRRGRGGAAPTEEIPAGEELLEVPTADEAQAAEEAAPVAAAVEEMAPAADETVQPAATTRRRRGGRRRRTTEAAAMPDPISLSVPPVPEPVLEEISAEDAAQAMLGILSAIPEEETAETTEPATEATVPAEVTEPAPAETPKRTPRRRTRRTKIVEDETLPAVESLFVTPIEPAAIPLMPEDDTAAESAVAVEAPPDEAVAPVADEKPKRRRRVPTSTATVKATPRRRTRKAAPPAEAGGEEAPAERTDETTTE